MIIRRIIYQLGDLRSLQRRESDEDEDDEPGNEGGAKGEENKIGSEAVSSVPAPTQPFAVSFRDVEESICPFYGNDNLSIRRWIEEFEEAANHSGWDMRKLIVVKKSLKGTAKLFIQGEPGITFGEKLRKAMSEEFER